ncbi:hypothetical protein [Nocardia salmonicida]|uniref:hypothetical protein n=1 Tax=Nocardia salmonicida TaxID=53431 RepID=UPI001041D874|nr:hypothetical protein [Nocardia salmonicida]
MYTILVVCTASIEAPGPLADAAEYLAEMLRENDVNSSISITPTTRNATTDLLVFVGENAGSFLTTALLTEMLYRIRKKFGKTPQGSAKIVILDADGVVVQQIDLPENEPD